MMDMTSNVRPADLARIETEEQAKAFIEEQIEITGEDKNNG